MTEYTPEKVTELVGRLNDAAGSPYTQPERSDAIEAGIRALIAVSAERDWHRSHYERLLQEKVTLRADRDRLHKAITEALAGLELSAEPDWPGWNVLTGTENILRAALDQEGNDDGA